MWPSGSWKSFFGDSPDADLPQSWPLSAHSLHELTQLRDLDPTDLTVLQIQGGEKKDDKPFPREPRSDKTRHSLRDRVLLFN